jgi:hypothetical protein
MPTVRLKLAVVIAVLAIAAGLSASASAAAPRYILVTGPSLQRPVVLGKWSENLALLTDLIPTRRPAPGWRSTNRPRYKLALFWGVPARPVPSDPNKASQVGWFYPSVSGRRAVVVLLVSGRDGPRVASRDALRILGRNGIPTRVR